MGLWSCAVLSAVARSKVIPPAGAGNDELIVKVRIFVPTLPSVAVRSLMVSVGSGACTFVVAVVELLPATGSDVAELTVVILAMVVPFPPLAVAIRVMVAVEPLGSEGKLMNRLLPAPPQAPPPVEEHEINVTETGKLSVSTTECAVPGPLLVTVIV